MKNNNKNNKSTKDNDPNQEIRELIALMGRQNAEFRQLLLADRKQRADESAQRAKYLAEEIAQRAKERTEDRNAVEADRKQRADERAEDRKAAEDERKQRAKERAEDRTEYAKRHKVIGDGLTSLEATVQSTSRQVKETSRQLGGFGNTCGGAVEDLFWHSIREQCRTDDGRFLLDDVRYDSIKHNVFNGSAEDGIEIDLVLANSKAVAFVEVKNKVRMKDLDDLLQRRYPRMKSGYPEHADTRLYLASVQISESMVQRALSKGVSVLQISGDVLVTQSSKQPRIQ